ncbi:glycoside hydrolase family 47 protein [Flagelloscypha sp. PMI_526]|nr:glycoside hydrolase family 47 protein [Flagelloscypha sp. PMI_526]
MVAFLFPLTLALSGFPWAFAANIQKSGLRLPRDAKTHRDEVIQIFTKSYETYKKYAWGHDDVQPISQTWNDHLNGWGATIVDVLTTAHVMGLNDYVNEAINYVGTIDYQIAHNDGSVSLFETTIRHLGGLLSSYELTGKKHKVLLDKAVEIADKLAYGWVNGSDVPYGHLLFTRDAPSVPEDLTQTSNIAEAGTLIIEWGSLSRFTGNTTYNALAEKSFRRIMNNPAPLPGFAAQGISPATGDPVGGYVSWGGGSDSYFEYLVKHTRLTNTDDKSYIDAWHAAVDSTISTLLRRSTVGNWLYAADMDSQKRIRHVGSHLACFYGGNFIMGGKMLNNKTIVDIGLDLNEACWNTYAGSTSGIGPEGFAYISTDGNFTGSDISPEQIEFYGQHGFYSTSSYYILRPEVLESNFYAWRTTGNTKYLDRAAQAIQSFNKWLPASNFAANATGYGGLNDVLDPTGGGPVDDTESFWFAETLKYLYLIFDDPEHINLDHYVFNTEAHPFKAPPAKPSYGSGHPVPPNQGPFRVNHGDPLPAVSPAPKVPASTPEPTPQ